LDNLSCAGLRAMHLVAAPHASVTWSRAQITGMLVAVRWISTVNGPIAAVLAGISVVTDRWISLVSLGGLYRGGRRLAFCLLPPRTRSPRLPRGGPGGAAFAGCVHPARPLRSLLPDWVSGHHAH